VTLDGVLPQSRPLGAGSNMSKPADDRALEQAIEKRQPEPDLVRHSDRGLQYVWAEQLRRLRILYEPLRTFSGMIRYIAFDSGDNPVG